MMANKRHDVAAVSPLALSEQLRTVLKLMVREMRRDAVYHEFGLSLMQATLLTTIEEHPDIGVSDLARIQHVRSPTVSGQIKVLETAGFLERSMPQAHDRRRSGLRITKDGQESLQKLRAHRLDWLSRRVARLTPEQMDALAAAMEPLEIISKP